MEFSKKIHYFFASILFMFLSQSVFASGDIVIFPKTIISHSKTYKNQTIDLSHGSFIIRNDATLTFDNCLVKGTLSKSNPVLIAMEKGKLFMKDSQVNVHVEGIPPHPMTQSLHYVIQVTFGKVTLDTNNFVIDKDYAAGLLITSGSFPTPNFKIVNNKFNGFHGVLYLVNSDNALVADNIFDKNSYGHIVMIGNNSKIIHNNIFFSGNDRLGNAIDIIDSDTITVSRNNLWTPTCHGIYVINSHNLTIDSNRVTGGITYAMSILTYPETADTYIHDFLQNYHMNHILSTNISITNNYMAQNRYGIAATDVDHLTIANNIFIQRFEDAATRKFWTNNKILLKNITNLTWTNNIYKEAFTQDNHGDNSHSMKVVPFPKTGGVVL